jgi:hypothetical protein
MRELHKLQEQVHALAGAIQQELAAIDRLIHDAKVGAPDGGEPGRPEARPTLEQAFWVLFERASNGRVGVHELARRTGTSWRMVQRVLEGDYASYQNLRKPYRKPSE